VARKRGDAGAYVRKGVVGEGEAEGFDLGHAAPGEK